LSFDSVAAAAWNPLQISEIIIADSQIYSTIMKLMFQMHCGKLYLDIYAISAGDA